MNKTTDAMGYSEYYYFDDAGNRIAVKDKNGYWTNYTYDELNRVTKVTDSFGNNDTYTYDAMSNVINQTDRNDNYITKTYDSLNRLSSQTDILGNTEYYYYDEIGNQISHKNKNGYYANNTVDQLNRVNVSIDALGNREYFTYDEVGNMINRTDKEGKYWTYDYDAMNRMVNSTDPLGNKETTTYDAIGNRINITDKNGKSILYEFDELNRVVKITDPLGYYESFDLDAMGNVLNYTDKKSAKTIYEYNDRNVLISINSTTGNKWEYDCDGLSNVVKLTNPTGTSKDVTYDDNGRIVGVDYYEWGFYEVEQEIYQYGYELEYDDADNIIFIDGGDRGQINYTYDSLNRLTEFKVNYGSFQKTVSYGYDAQGNIINMTDPDGRIINYVYDGLNQLVSIQDPTLGYFNYTYDNEGRRINLTYPYGGYVTYAYDNAGRLISINFNNINVDNISYSYDNKGNIVSKTVGSSTINYVYDDRDQLISVEETAQTTNYTYDENGNRETMEIIGGGPTTNFNYNTENQLTSITGVYNYEYDECGNLIAKKDPMNSVIETYGYDADGNMINYTLLGGALIEYIICPLGKRMAKVENDVYEFYICDRNQRLLVMNGTGDTQKRYLWNPSVIDDSLAYIDIAGSNEFLNYNDHLRTIIAESDENGNSVSSFTFTAFGEGTVSNSGYGFTGRLYDSDTGMYYYRARMYDPTVGRFTSKDPIAFREVVIQKQEGCGGCGCEGSNSINYLFNSYIYCDNDPINNVDPNGKLAACAAAKLIAAYFIVIYKRWWNDKRGHCWVTCELVKDCRINRVKAIAIVSSKEALTYVTQKLGFKSTGWSWNDIYANTYGAVVCATKRYFSWRRGIYRDCDRCCRGKYK